MACAIKTEKLLDRRSVCELDRILDATSDFLEAAEEQDLHANRL
jgi:hypothetical protein